MSRKRMRLIGLLLLPVVVIIMTGCNEVMKFHPAVAVWTAATSTNEEKITALVIQAGAKAKLTNNARTTSAQFKFAENNCKTGNVLETGQECSVKIKLEAPYVRELAKLILEGEIIVNGKKYEGMESSTLRTR